MLKNLISRSDYCLIFSDLFHVLLKNNPNEIIENLDNLINIFLKNKKTIILPAFNLNFPKTKKAGNSSNFIQTGFFNKYLIKKYKFFRTSRPMYNYAVIGPKSKNILKLKQETAWGKDSVIGYLTKKNALGVGLNIDKKTFNWVVIHHCEEINKVPYRYYKIFRGKNIDLKSRVIEKMYVRDLNLKFKYSKLINKKLIKKKFIRNFKFKKINVTLLNLFNYYKEANLLLKKDLYSLIKNEK
jgi:aminoglycoside N3'-acetyltransferase